MPTSIQAAMTQSRTMNQRFETNATALAMILTAKTFDAQATAEANELPLLMDRRSTVHSSVEVSIA